MQTQKATNETCRTCGSTDRVVNDLCPACEARLMRTTGKSGGQRSREAEATALGHLVFAADTAEKLIVVLTALREIVKGRTEPTALIGTPMAEVIEHYAAEVVGAIREAHLVVTTRDARE